FLRSLALVRRTTPPDARFLTTMPEPLYYHTGRRSISTERATWEPELLAHLRERGVEYVLLTPTAGWIRERLAPRCDELVVVGSLPERTALLRIAGPAENPSSEAGPESTACDVIASHQEEDRRGGPTPEASGP
ncbi:MAG: hypothetical protein ACRELC_09500, partial [Gemmatimonadota bacterium]